MKKTPTKKTTSIIKTSAKTKKASAKTKKTPSKAKTANKFVSSVQKKRRITFTYRAENGCSVFLAGNFNKWSATAKAMTDKKNIGVYTAIVTLAPGSYEYKFVINDIWCADPECADWVQNSHGTLNSVKHVSL